MFSNSHPAVELTRVKLVTCTVIKYLDGSKMSGGRGTFLIRHSPLQAINTLVKAGYECRLILSLSFQEG